MRPFFNSFVPVPNQFPQQNFQANPQQALQNPMQSQIGMVNPQPQFPMGNPQLIGQSSNPPQLVNNPFVGLLNNLIPNGNQVNPNSQIAPQFFNNLTNVPQQVHQFPLPSMNQLLPQGAPYVPNLLENLQLVMANANILGQSLVQTSLNSFPQVQVNSSNSLSYSPARPHHNQNLQPPVFSKSQGQSVPNVHSSNLSSNRNDLRHNKFNKNLKMKVPSQGFQKSQFRQADDGKRYDGKGKGQYNKMAAKLYQSDSANMAKDKKRSFALVYTEKEIQQWREQRRKNYPSKANMEKKLKRRPSNCNVDEEEKIRCQQLKDVLAKQVELGVEVAEIPSYYLSNANRHANRGEENGKQFGKDQRYQNKKDKRGRFDNKHNKRGKNGKREKFDKKERFQDKDSTSVSSLSTRKPTLLEKLLRADIKREKNQLLQVFRFIVMNSFFEKSSEQPLKFPLVAIKENCSEHRTIQETSVLVEEDYSNVRSNTRAEISKDDDNDDDDDGEQHDELVEEEIVKREDDLEQEITKNEEEGEIID